MNNQLWIDQKYIALLSAHLPKFKKVRDNLWNFRCIICGDSKTNENKTRGYLFLNGDHYTFKCHNCGEGMSLRNFLKVCSVALHDQYANELFMNKIGKSVDTAAVRFDHHIEKVEIRRHEKFDPLTKLKKISQLPHDHPAKKYVVKRMIPSDKHWMLYYAPKFNKWINTFIPDKLSEKHDQPRLVLPFIDENGYVFAVAGRSFDPNSAIKYLTIKFDDNKPKIFGLNTVDWERRVRIVEGPIDSLFVDNSIALAGTDGDLSFITQRENCTIVLDNQPRNKEVVAKLRNYISNGWSVCIWPENILQKDINDMVTKGKIPVDQITDIIDTNTFYDLVATLKVSQWSKL